MSPGDHGQPETLRSLASEQRLPPRHRTHHAVVGDDDGVGRRHRNPSRRMNLQRGHAVRNDPLIHQRPRRIMQQHPAVAARPDPLSAAQITVEPACRRATRSRAVVPAARRAARSRTRTRDGRQGHPSRVRSGRATLDDVRDLPVAAIGEHDLDLFRVPARHHDEDLVDARRLVEGGHAPLHQRLAAQRQQLLRHPRAEPLPDAAAQHHRDHPHGRTLPPRPRRRLSPARTRTRTRNHPL